jgi:Alternative complex III, ActD subunit
MPMRSQPFALVGAWRTPGGLYRACEALRDGGYRRFDAHTPFPVHGLERAMGLPPSRLPWIVLGCGLLGGAGAFALQSWVHAVAYPQVISGKPFFAFQAYVPITFELTVLFAAFGTFFGVWGLSRLPRLFHPVMQHPAFARTSDDRFLLSVEATDDRFDLDRTRALLVELGAEDVQEVEP